MYPSLRRIKDTGPPWRSRRTLPGLVVCPEDPTIPLYGKGFAGRNLFTEKDALPTNGLWPTFTPQPVLDELRSADYVIDVTNYERKDVEDGLLVRLGFEPVAQAPPDLECLQILAAQFTCPRHSMLAASHSSTVNRLRSYRDEDNAGPIES